mmetsp:Transcript_10619/g.24623  ORF Transcript_10619/g.24623 Transcript_10619/m.24623 type:complete len:213 (-) Transcript_10619:554-1192(-)
MRDKGLPSNTLQQIIVSAAHTKRRQPFPCGMLHAARAHDHIIGRPGALVTPASHKLLRYYAGVGAACGRTLAGHALRLDLGVGLVWRVGSREAVTHSKRRRVLLEQLAQLAAVEDLPLVPVTIHETHLNACCEEELERLHALGDAHAKGDQADSRCARWLGGPAQRTRLRHMDLRPDCHAAEVGRGTPRVRRAARVDLHRQREAAVAAVEPH